MICALHMSVPQKERAADTSEPSLSDAILRDGEERSMVSEQLSSAVSVSTNMSKVGLKVRYYIALESTWHILLYATCWRYRPTVLVMESARGRAIVTRVSDTLTRWKWNTFSKMGANVYNTKWKRALAEWTIINKIAAPVSFPVKIYVAHRLAKRHERMSEESAQQAPRGEADLHSAGKAPNDK